LAKGRRQVDLAAISLDDALERLVKIEDRIEDDVRKALWAEAVLEAGNDLIHTLEDKGVPGADAYNVISQGLMINLAATLSRLYDRAPDVASIVTLVSLIERRDIRDHLTERARKWIPAMADQCATDCAGALDQISKMHSKLQDEERGLLRDLRDFRDSWIAHSLIDIKSGRPQYNSLFRLLFTAATIAERAKLAIHGDNLNYAELKDFNREVADDFWKNAFRTKYRINQDLRPLSGPIGGAIP
jgi:hypothetical protein